MVSTKVVETMSKFIDIDDAYHQSHWKRIGRTLTLLEDLSPSGRLLEIGSEGFMCRVIQDMYPDLEIDITASEGFNGFKFFDIDLETQEIPVEDSTYDFILCCEVLEHMDVDPMFLLSEINRVISDDGSLILTTPNITSANNVKKMVFGYDPYFFLQYRKDKSPYRHNYEYSVHTLRCLLKSAGFTGSMWTEDLFQEQDRSVVYRLKEMGYTSPHDGDNLISISHKTGGVIDRYPSLMYV